MTNRIIKITATLLALLWCGSVCRWANGQQPNRGTSPIKLTDLDQPPKEIADLIKQATIKMESGQKSDEEMLAIAERSSFSGPVRRLAAETTFQMKYKTQNRTRWRTTGPSDMRVLNISVTFQHGKLIRQHTIWFRRRPPTDEFWENQLVLHELDHVRISNHTHFEKVFRRKLAEIRTIRHPLQPNQSASNALVQQVVNQRVDEVFQEVLELVRIRYRELDRQTDHGLKPLLDDSPVAKLIQEDER